MDCHWSYVRIPVPGQVDSLITWNPGTTCPGKDIAPVTIRYSRWASVNLFCTLDLKHLNPGPKSLYTPSIHRVSAKSSAPCECARRAVSTRQLTWPGKTVLWWQSDTVGETCKSVLFRSDLKLPTSKHKEAGSTQIMKWTFPQVQSGPGGGGHLYCLSTVCNPHSTQKNL